MCVPLILTLIEKEGSEFTVVTNQENLKNLFSNLYDKENVVYIEPFEAMRFWEKALFLPRWFRYKYRVLNRLQFIQKSSIYFFFVAFGLYESWLIRKLSERNDIIYSPIINVSHWSKLSGLKVSIKVLYIRLIYGITVSPKLLGEASYWTISPLFLNVINAKVIKLEADLKIVTALVKNKFNFGPGEILYATGGVIEEKHVAVDEFIIKTDAVLSFLARFNILLKSHPRFPMLTETENTLPQVPSYIPGNLLLCNFKVIVGYASALIFEAANYGCTAISLLDYFKENSSAQKESFKSYLEENLHSNKRIYYPKDPSELQAIIFSVLKQNE
jgi:hypothetical protein